MSHVFDVMLEGMYAYPEETFRYWSNTNPDEIYRVLQANGYWQKFYEDALQVMPRERDWFYALKDRNPWFGTDKAKKLICSRDDLYVERDYIEFTFQVAKAFIPGLLWLDLPVDTVPVLNFHASQRLTDAV